MKSIRHHIEYDLNPLGIKKIEDMIKERKLIYNYKTDQRQQTNLIIMKYYKLEFTKLLNIFKKIKVYFLIEESKFNLTIVYLDLLMIKVGNVSRLTFFSDSLLSHLFS